MGLASVVPVDRKRRCFCYGDCPNRMLPVKMNLTRTWTSLWLSQSLQFRWGSTCQIASVLPCWVAHDLAKCSEKPKEENQQDPEELQAPLFPQGYVAAARVMGPAAVPCWRGHQTWPCTALLKYGKYSYCFTSPSKALASQVDIALSCPSKCIQILSPEEDRDSLYSSLDDAHSFSCSITSSMIIF